MDITNLKATAIYENSTQENTVVVTPYVVNDAFFATKKEEILYDTKKTTKKHTAVKGDNLSKIASTLGVSSVAELKKQNNLTSDQVSIGQNFTVTLEEKTEKGKKVTFKQITQASVGDAVYLVVKTTALEGKTLKVKIHQGKEKVLAEVDNAVTLLHEGSDAFEFKAVVGELANEAEILNKEELKNLGVVNVTLAPKEEKDLKQWNDDIKKRTDKKTYLYLYVEADVPETVKYYGKNDDGTGDDPKKFCNKEGRWLELKAEEYKVCPINPKYRSHFVIHCTSSNMTKKGIASKTTYYVKKVKQTKRGAGHIYVMSDGSKVQIWPLAEKNVWATKLESKKGLKGQMFHIELNYGPPNTPTEAQYQTLAELYIEASKLQKCWPIIVPHIEVDRGLADGHKDPTDFDYNHFYSILKSKGLPIDDIKKFDHDRYWGHKSYKVPWTTDKANWPLVLKGNPHK